MDSICACLVHDHRRCDNLLMKAERNVSRLDWISAEQDFQCFSEALLRHMEMEESILFPAFEKAIPNAGYPLALLRREHEGIKGILARLTDSVQRRDADEFILHSETFTLVMQEHRLKEEEIIYPALDRLLGSNTQPLLFAMCQAIQLPHAGAAGALPSL